MSSPIQPLDYLKSAEEALHFLDLNTFTATCLSKHGTMIDKFVTREGLKKAQSSRPINDLCQPISSQLSIDMDTGVLDSVPKLAENMKRDSTVKFLFCTSNSTVEGIMTSADLNKPEVNVCIMPEIIGLETLLTRLITEKIQNWELAFKRMDDIRYMKCRQRWSEDRKRDCALDFIYSLELSDKLMLVRNDATLRDRIFSKDRKEIGWINVLRNTVAHSKQSLGSKGSKLYNVGHEVEYLNNSIRSLKQMSQNIHKVLQ